MLSKKRQHVFFFFELAPSPHRRLCAAVPDVTGFEPCLEEDILAFVAMLLMDGAEVPEHRNIIHDPSPLVEVLPDDESNDVQLECRRIRMTSGSEFPRPRHSAPSRTATNTTQMEPNRENTGSNLAKSRPQRVTVVEAKSQACSALNIQPTSSQQSATMAA